MHEMLGTKWLKMREIRLRQERDVSGKKQRLFGWLKRQFGLQFNLLPGCFPSAFISVWQRIKSLHMIFYKSVNPFCFHKAPISQFPPILFSKNPPSNFGSQDFLPFDSLGRGGLEIQSKISENGSEVTTGRPSSRCEAENLNLSSLICDTDGREG